jgi:hypothetical protein
MALMGLGLALVTNNALAEQEHQPLRSDPVEAPGGAISRKPSGRAEAIDGKTIAHIPVWKQITLGSYKGVNALREALDAARVRRGDSADEILGRPGFLFSNTKTDVDLVVVSVSELGFDSRTSLGDIYRRARELGLELCPAEVAPLLRLQYLNQPIGEFLNIAMRPIATYRGELIALSVANAGTGPLILGGEGHSELIPNWKARFVFVRPARIALPSGR